MIGLIIINKNSLFVIDNFYKNPDKIRNFAQNTNDYIKQGSYYESQKLYYNDSIIKSFEEIIGEKIYVDPVRFGFGSLAYFAQGDQMHKYTHYDSNEWVALVYLVPDHFVGNGGLVVCRHKETGLEGPPDETWLNKNGYASFKEWEDKIYRPSQTNTDAWETTIFIAMKYNRLIIQKAGKMFHRGTEGFGTIPANSRLMHRFFFETQKR